MQSNLVVSNLSEYTHSFLYTLIKTSVRCIEVNLAPNARGGHQAEGFNRTADSNISGSFAQQPAAGSAFLPTKLRVGGGTSGWLGNTYQLNQR